MLLSLVHSFLRVQAMLKRQNRIMSEQHGLDRRTEQIKEKKLLRTVIEMFVCFVVVYIPFFVVSVLQEQGMLHSVDPIVVTQAVFLMTYATNFLVYGRNLHVLFASFCSLCQVCRYAGMQVCQVCQVCRYALFDKVAMLNSFFPLLFLLLKL